MWYAPKAGHNESAKSLF
jgi:hypothetical protein